MRLTVSRIMILFGVLVCLSTMMLVALSWLSLKQVEVNGPIYNRIVAGKDLIGDILPPPEYIIEAYLEVNLAVQDPETADQHKSRIERLRREYDERHAYWAAADLPADLKQKLIEASHNKVQLFWRQLDEQLFPALAKRDMASVTAALTAIRETYAEHRRIIDQISSDATQVNTATENEAASLVSRFVLLLSVGSLLAGGLIVGGFAFIGRRITRPLTAMTQHMSEMAAGDYGQPTPSLQRHDEFGAMAKAMQIFKLAASDNLRLQEEAERARAASEAERSRAEAERAAAARELAEVVDGIGRGLDQLAQGALTFRLNQSFAAEYEKLRIDFNDAVARLADTMTVVASNTSAIRSGTSEISSAADDLSRRTEQQAASLEETAAALDEVTATVRKTSQSANYARDVVGAAKAGAEQSGAVVRRAVEAMMGIERSAHEISQIIGVIDEIAFQTNLLALNAGVEAARAGEAGRGFAVVASEVRALAQRSAEAAKEIKSLISASGRQVEQGVELVGETGKALERILGQVAELNTIVAEIAASAHEQALGLDQINTAINQMDQVTQQNATMVEESTAASRALSRETEELAGVVGRFRLEDPTLERSRPRGGGIPRSIVQIRATGRGGAARRPSADAETGSGDWQAF